MGRLQPHEARIQIEYAEMPNLKLTLAQVRRLCGLPLDVCEAALSSLVEADFLWKAGDGSYLRHRRGPQPDAIVEAHSLETNR